MAYCTKTDGDYRLFDEGGRKVEESREAGFERRKVEGGGRPAGAAAPEGGGFGRRSRHGGRRPPALRAVFRGLAGACGGGNSAGDCPQKTAERETMLEQQRGYDDIIGLKRPFSRYRRMPRPERAVQFAPFATLTGHEEILQETARPTDGCPRLEEDERSLLDARLQLLRLLLPGRPWVTVTWFEPDGKKAGGTCLTATGQALRLKEEPPRLVFSDGREVLLERVLTLGGDFAGGMPE